MSTIALELRISSLRGVVFGLMMIAAMLSGCTSQPAAIAPEVTATSAEQAKPQVAVEESSDSAAPAEQHSTAQSDAPAPIDEIVAAPSNNAPTQVNDAAESTAETPPPQQDAPEQVARDENNGRELRTVFFRADVNQPPSMPPVVLSKGHEALCRVKVGDTMPEIELEQLGGGRRRLAELAGKKATVVVFWKSGRRMTDQQLTDVGPDVIEPFGKAGIAVVGIAVGESPANAQTALERAGADFPTLLDADGKAFAQVGSEKLPRTFLLDPQGKILWFDIEYSLSTRRELHQALRAVTGEQAESNGN